MDHPVECCCQGPLLDSNASCPTVLAVNAVLGRTYLGKSFLCKGLSLAFEPLTSLFACVVVVICHVQEACHHRVST